MIRIAYVRPVDIGFNGLAVDKNNKSTTLNSLLNVNKEMRVMPKNSSPNSHDYPTIEQYLIREDQDSFRLSKMDNNIIITRMMSNGDQFDHSFDFQLS